MRAVRHRALHVNHLASWTWQLRDDWVKDLGPHIPRSPGDVASALASLTQSGDGDGRRRGYIQLRLIAERDQVTRDLYEAAGLDPGSKVALANDLAMRLPAPRTMETVSHIAFVLDIDPGSVEQYIKRARRKLAGVTGTERAIAA